MYKSKEEMMSDLNFYHRYMFYEQIKNLNESWAILAKSNDKHPAIMESNIIDYMKNSPNFIKPIEWVDIFTKNICKDTSVQTDDIKNNTSEISTQTSNENVQNKDNSTRSKTEKIEKKIKNNSSYADAIKSTSNKNNSNTNNFKISNKMSEIYNVKTNNYFEKLSSINANQPIGANQSTGTATKTNFNKKTPTKSTPNQCYPPPKRDTFRQNSSSLINKKQQQGNTANFNSRKPKFNTEVHSPSLQRDKWQKKSPYFKENSINNFNSNNKNRNYFNFPRGFNSNDNKNPNFYQKNNREFRQNSNNRKKHENLNKQDKNRNYYNQNDNRKFSPNFKNQNMRNSFENDTFGNNLPLILTSLFMQWIQSNYNSNQINNKKKSFNNYKNMKNQNCNPYGKIII